MHCLPANAARAASLHSHRLAHDHPLHPALSHRDATAMRKDGLLLRSRLSNTCPRIMHIDTEYELWSSRFSRRDRHPGVPPSAASATLLGARTRYCPLSTTTVACCRSSGPSRRRRDRAASEVNGVGTAIALGPTACRSRQQLGPTVVAKSLGHCERASRETAVELPWFSTLRGRRGARHLSPATWTSMPKASA